MNKIFSLIRIIEAAIIVFFSSELESTLRPYGSFGETALRNLDQLMMAFMFVFSIEIILNLVKLIVKEKTNLHK